MPEAIPVFDDPYALTITDDESDPSEQRFATIGLGALVRLLVVCVRVPRAERSNHLRTSLRTA